MDNAQSGAAADKPSAAVAAENSDPNPRSEPLPERDASEPPQQRTSFTCLSQVDADLALARAIQDQERAYMMVALAGEQHAVSVADELYADIYGGSYDDEAEWIGYNDFQGEEEDAFDANDDRAVDPLQDEALARALQDEAERDEAELLMAMAGLNNWEAQDLEDHDGSPQDDWQEVDPDELSYEELIALGEVVGTESRGLSADVVASLPSVTYKAKSVQDGNSDQCVVCRVDYEDGDSLTILSCRHMYHPECINKWLQIKKVCPICIAEVSTSGNTHE